MDPLTPMTGAVGGIGRTPIPVAESTRHPGERPLTPVGKLKRERPDQRGEFLTPAPDQGGNTEEAQGDYPLFDMKCMYYIYHTNGALGMQSSVVLW